MDLEANKLRIEAWHDARDHAKRYMRTPGSKKVLYDPDLEITPRFSNTKVSVIRSDTIEAGIDLLNQGLNPVLLNFSDDACAGGYVEDGSAAQEESLFRRTDYCNTLVRDFYPLGKLEAVYSPSVVVFKGPESEGWCATDPVELSFIACPALRRPRCANDRLTEEDAETFAAKIRLVLQTAYGMGHDSVVLGAWGCGAWSNPPRHVAEIFESELRACAGAFRELRFAILDDGPPYDEEKRYGPSFEVFREVLCGTASVDARLP
jgi:uncharacterized protein (TIGR02452 family)